MNVLQALELGQFALWCQPLVAARDGSVDCVQASVRWHLPEGAVLPLCAFTDALARPATQQLFALHMLCDALAALRMWSAEGFELDMVLDLPLPVLGDVEFQQRVLDLLQQAGVAPQRLSLRQAEAAGCCQVSNLLDWLHVREAGCSQAAGEFIVSPQPMQVLPAALRRWQASYAVLSAADAFS